VSAVYVGGAPVAELVRSGFVESRHRGSVVVLDPGGRVLAAIGDIRGPIFPRSSNKPMQAVALLRSGLELRDPADLALVAASHSGEPRHVERVRSLLRRSGLTEADLGCPADFPLSEAARNLLLRRGGSPARVLMNCSGKHTGMLMTCVANGWSTEDYLRPDHPVQQACATAIADLAGEPVAAIGVDGCGAPVAAISLTGLARAFLYSVQARPGDPARRVADAMRGEPELVSGTGREDALMMRAIPGLLTKTGAEGVFAVASPELGAVALKVDDGAMRAARPILAASLACLGVSAPAGSDAEAVLAGFAQTPVLGGGAPVGSVRATASLLDALAGARSEQAHASGS
jgi:L-asparaginase II